MNMRLMNPLIIILTVLAAGTLLTGCGVRKEDHQKVVRELAQAKRMLQEASAETANLRTGAVTRLTLDLKRANDRIIALNAEIDRLKNLDVYTFMEAGRLRDTGDLAGALQAYLSFVRDFPASPQSAAARTQIEQIERQIDAQRTEAASRDEHERTRQAQQELIARMREGLTVAEWWDVLRGKTVAEVKNLLGTPGYTSDDDRRWTYYSRSVTPNSGKKEILRVFFRDGAVVATQGDSGQMYSE